MSGICAEIVDDTGINKCSECGQQEIQDHFCFCPMCGKHIVMIWDTINDCKIFPIDE